MVHKAITLLPNKKIKFNYKSMFEGERLMAQEFLRVSQERGKALSIVLPLVSREGLAELFAELYDRRQADIEDSPSRELRRRLN